MQIYCFNLAWHCSLESFFCWTRMPLVQVWYLPIKRNKRCLLAKIVHEWRGFSSIPSQWDSFHCVDLSEIIINYYCLPDDHHAQNPNSSKIMMFFSLKRYCTISAFWHLLIPLLGNQTAIILTNLWHCVAQHINIVPDHKVLVESLWTNNSILAHQSHITDLKIQEMVILLIETSQHCPFFVILNVLPNNINLHTHTHMNTIRNMK